MIQRFGKFLVEQHLGVGGMSAVFKAIDEESDQTIALKILHTQWAADPNFVRRFQREAEIASQLQHPHIITIFEYGQISGRSYLSMQYMPGGSLAQLFEQPARMSLVMTARLLKQVAGALDYAHLGGVVHRDMKLENVLLDERHRPILSDFGIARVLDGTRLTTTGTITGTPLYMSPEQARGESDLDYRSDLYSLAVMAYLMATGYFPFTGTTPYVILNQHLNRVPPAPSCVNPALPPALDTVLLKGLSKQPEDRFLSAGDFAAAFEDAVAGSGAIKTLILTSHPTPVLPDEPGTNTAEKASTVILKERPARRSRAGLFLFLILSVLGAGLVGFAGRAQTPNTLPTPTEGSAISRYASATSGANEQIGNAAASPTPASTTADVATTVAPTVPTATLVLLTNTPVPPAPVPPTPVPPTPMPPTPVPPTPVPPTPVPPTPVPPTPVPPTPVPPTPAPAPTATKSSILPLPVPLPTISLGL